MCSSLSGGILMVPQKHGEASKFIYNFGFYLTANVYHDFGKEMDGQEIKKPFKGLRNEVVKPQRYQCDR